MARVLLIEDDLAVQKGVTLALKRRGHEVEVAASGETGLLLLERHRPDLVLLDLMLPGMSGLEVCRRIRESKQLPIIILSAPRTPTSAATCRRPSPSRAPTGRAPWRRPRRSSR
ncbi:response regulator, partial [Streptomyces sp. NPDC089915]|uniref:response regulator n=1 Tax=Streptomyces sp. NPDC089915 TaxID=3155186 RepID=UPI00341B1C41